MYVHVCASCDSIRLYSCGRRDGKVIDEIVMFPGTLYMFPAAAMEHAISFPYVIYGEHLSATWWRYLVYMETTPRDIWPKSWASLCICCGSKHADSLAIQLRDAITLNQYEVSDGRYRSTEPRIYRNLISASTLHSRFSKISAENVRRLLTATSASSLHLQNSTWPWRKFCTSSALAIHSTRSLLPPFVVNRRYCATQAWVLILFNDNICMR